MARRTSNTPEAPVSERRNPGKSSWGKSKAPLRLPSGKPLPFTEIEQNAILQFMGVKDISNKVVDRDTGEICEKGTVLYYVFHDGKRVVTLPEGAALRELREAIKDPETGEEYIPLEENDFIYIELVDFVETKEPTPMKDFFVAGVGLLDEKVEIPEDMAELLKDLMDKDGKFHITFKNISKANYEKLNYPLRKV